LRSWARLALDVLRELSVRGLATAITDSLDSDRRSLLLFKNYEFHSKMLGTPAMGRPIHTEDYISADI